jgi:hypothetical protein
MNAFISLCNYIKVLIDDKLLFFNPQIVELFVYILIWNFKITY